MIEMYRQENAELDRRINMMKTDRDTLEKFAREQFFFAAPGEDVYILEDQIPGQAGNDGFKPGMTVFRSPYMSKE